MRALSSVSSSFKKTHTHNKVVGVKSDDRSALLFVHTRALPFSLSLRAPAKEEEEEEEGEGEGEEEDKEEAQIQKKNVHEKSERERRRHRSVRPEKTIARCDDDDDDDDGWYRTATTSGRDSIHGSVAVSVAIRERE